MTCSPFPSRISESVRSAFGSIRRSLKRAKINWKNFLEGLIYQIHLVDSIYLGYIVWNWHTYTVEGLEWSCQHCRAPFPLPQLCFSNQARQNRFWKKVNKVTPPFFWRSWTHFNEVWMVSSTWSIASLTWKRRGLIQSKQYSKYL